jgi:hypothetical protein
MLLLEPEVVPVTEPDPPVPGAAVPEPSTLRGAEATGTLPAAAAIAAASAAVVPNGRMEKAFCGGLDRPRTRSTLLIGRILSRC